MDFIIDFLTNWQPDLLLTLIVLISGIAQIVAPLFLQNSAVKRWRVGGVITLIFGLLLLAIRFI
jgi:heme/copper-type cytochrome/quinol oxidase subunit 3